MTELISGKHPFHITEYSEKCSFGGGGAIEANDA